MRTREMATSFLTVPQVSKLKEKEVDIMGPLYLSGPDSLVQKMRSRLLGRGQPLVNTAREARILLFTEIAPRTPWKNDAGDESYRLEIRAKEQGVLEFHLAGGSLRALHYGMGLVESLLKKGTCQLGVFEDWPSFAMRGLVEGFYGTPWTNERRLEILSFLSENKFNYYIYAPKSDPYHRALWRDPYPPNLLTELGQQISHATEVGVTWVFAVSPGLSLCYSSEGDYAALIQKLQAIYDLGCRDFGLFFDDVPDHLVNDPDSQVFGNLAEAQTHLIRRLYNHFQSSDNRVHFFICPTVYCGTGQSDYLRHLGQHLPAGVDVFWTGPSICSSKVTSDMAESVGQVLGRAPVLWDNYPVNDGVMGSELHMAPYTGRDDDLHRAMRGVFANPMPLAEASRIPLSCVAAYAWNPRRYRAAAVWEQAIKEVAPEAADAFQKFCACNPMSCLYEQPKILTQAIDQFKKSFWSGDFHGSIAQLHGFFTELQKDMEVIARTLTNRTLLREIRPWLDDVIFWCQIGRVGALCYRKAVEILTAKGQHPAAELIVRHHLQSVPATVTTAQAATSFIGSEHEDLDGIADSIDDKEAEALLVSLLHESVSHPTKAAGYVIHNFSQDALHALRAVRAG